MTTHFPVNGLVGLESNVTEPISFYSSLQTAHLAHDRFSRYAIGMNAYNQIMLGETPARRVPIGPLRCIVVDGSETPRIPVILCHGYGAPGDDLATLAPYLIDWLGPSAAAFRFVFPEAPESLAELGMPQGRAWWPLNMAKLQELLHADQFDQLHDKTPPGLEEARETLVETIKQAIASMPDSDQGESDAPKDAPGTTRPYVLGGFSQGAMLTMDVSLRSKLPVPKILVQFSGTLICQPEWEAACSRLANTFVLQSHGRSDTILPYSSAEALRDVLKQHNVGVKFVSFKGPHTIETETLMQLVQQLHELAMTMK